MAENQQLVNPTEANPDGTPVAPPPDKMAMIKCCAGCWCITFIFILTQVLEYAMTHRSCDPKAPPSEFGWEALPRQLTLDESASGAMDSIIGRSVNVFPGTSHGARMPGEIPLGKFLKVWQPWPWSDKYGYVEFTKNGEILRFTFTQSNTWLHTPHVLQPCDQGPMYQITRPNIIDGTTHDIFLVDSKNGSLTKIGFAKHQMQGLDVGASLFTGVNMNMKWSIVFHALDKATTVLGMAYQWYNHNMIANVGASNWAVSSKNASSLPQGIKPLPTHVVAYTSALYDLQTGSDRRRRTHHRR